MIKYTHIKRVQDEDVISGADVYPKLDGMNASVWWDEGIKCASRNRILTAESDCGGFHEWVTGGGLGKKFESWLAENPNLVVFGEWLVPHTIKGYQDAAWRNFWLFDIFDRLSGKYIERFERCWSYIESKYENIVPYLGSLGGHIDLPSALNHRFLLREDYEGHSEGIILVLQNAVDERGQVRRKIVKDEFLEQKRKPKIDPSSSPVESKLAAQCTRAMILKTASKVLVANGFFDYGEAERAGARGKIIPQLLSTVFYDFFHEDLWDLLKHQGQPKVDFRVMRKAIENRVREEVREWFR